VVVKSIASRVQCLSQFKPTEISRIVGVIKFEYRLKHNKVEGNKLIHGLNWGSTWHMDLSKPYKYYIPEKCDNEYEYLGTNEF
jgi:hypothetical protein